MGQTGKHFRFTGVMMAGSRASRLRFGLVAGAGAGLLALLAVPYPALADGRSPTPLADPGPPATVVMGATGLPDPATSTDYLAAAHAYIQDFLPGTDPAILATPEEFFPLTGSHSLTYDQSVGLGLADLNGAISADLAAGIPVGVFGVSQSADIASLEMEKLDPAGTPSDLPAFFVLLGDEMNPNGGLLERFVGANLTNLGVNFTGATPGNDFPTVIYTHEYDGFADFPRYPLDVLSDLNAAIGIAYDHLYTAAMIPTAFTLPTSGPTETTYYMIPTPELPLLEPLRAIPVMGNPIADLMQPDLTYLVNLGYGDPLYGWSTTAANIPTPFGLVPSRGALDQLPTLLHLGAEQGWRDFNDDLTGVGPHPVASSAGTPIPPPDPSWEQAGPVAGLADTSTTADPGDLNPA